MLRFVRYFLFIALFGTAFSLKATHNRAGEITYKWISGYTYSITLTTYTDDGPSVADRCQMTIYTGEGSCVAVRENGASAPSSATCPVSKLGEILKPGFKKNVYSCVHTYGGQGIYKIYVFDTNRNSGIVNIPNSVNQPFYIESLLTISAFLGPNNSSVLSFVPIDEAALNKCFYHNTGAYDIDGDSLSYELIMCKGEDAFGNIGVTIPGYSFPTNGTGGNFSIDSLTGTLSWCSPQQAGEYNVAILIKEWRRSGCSGNYALIGFVTRDMQILVSNGATNPPQFSVLTKTCIEAGSVLSTNINTSDAENATLTITATGSPFALSTAAFSSAASVNAAGTFSWAATCSNIRKQKHTAYFKVTENSSPVSLSNFLVYDISVIAAAPQNLIVTPALNTMQLSWNKPACHPTSGNKIVGYDIYRIVGASTWTHSACERGVPASSGFSFVGSTFSENDTTAVDYSVISLPNNTTCSYAVFAVYSDCSQSYASTTASNQLVIGVDEKIKNNYSANLFPNPSSAIFNLELVSEKQSYFSIELFDVNGRKIKAFGSTFVNGKTKLELDLKEFENGYYVLKIESEEKNCSYKPIIKLD